MGRDYVTYARAKFSTRLPTDRLYSPAHAWLKQDEDGLWRIGLTKFATRMLGEPVEFDLEVPPDTAVEVGQVVGWIEGFKAVTDLFCPATGRLDAKNRALNDDLSAVHTQPYAQGWLYAVEGTPADDCTDVDGYTALLDATIDKMLGRSE